MQDIYICTCTCVVIYQSRLDEELRAVPKLKRYWRSLQKKEKQADEETKERAQREKTFLANLIHLFMQVLSSIPEKGNG